MSQAIMVTSGFTSGQLIRQARLDANWNLETLAEHSKVSIEKLRALETDNKEAILIAKVSTADLTRLERTLRLPQDTLLAGNNDYLHRMVAFQRFITPRGFHAWIDLLHRFVTAHLTPDKNGVFESSALVKLRDNVEKQLEEKVVSLVRDGSISEGRGKELLNLTAWDELPR